MAQLHDAHALHSSWQGRAKQLHAKNNTLDKRNKALGEKCSKLATVARRLERTNQRLQSMCNGGGDMALSIDETCGDAHLEAEHIPLRALKDSCFLKVRAPNLICQTRAWHPLAVLRYLARDRLRWRALHVRRVTRVTNRSRPRTYVQIYKATTSKPEIEEVTARMPTECSDKLRAVYRTNLASLLTSNRNRLSSKQLAVGLEVAVLQTDASHLWVAASVRKLTRTTVEVQSSWSQTEMIIPYDALSTRLRSSATFPDLGRALTRSCVALWTHGDLRVFGRVQAALLSDNSTLLHSWVPFIRSMNCFLIKESPRPARATVVYRKSDLTKAQAALIEEGKEYRCGMFMATSTDVRVFATLHRNAGHFLWQLTVPAGCFQSSNIAGLSAFRDEAEVLLVPYTAIRVTRIDSGATASSPKLLPNEKHFGGTMCKCREATLARCMVCRATVIHATVMKDSMLAREDLPTIVV